MKECPFIDWVRPRIVGVKMIGELKMKRNQRTGKWIKKIRSGGEGCRNSGRSQESHVEEYGEERVDNNAISTYDHRLLNTLMLKDEVVRQMMTRKPCKVTSMSSERNKKMMTILAATWRTILQRKKCLIIKNHLGWQRPSCTTSQSAAQPPLQQIGDEKVVVTQVTIYTVKQVQNIVAG